MTYLVSQSDVSPEAEVVRRSREDRFCDFGFSRGPAWMAAPNAIFFRSSEELETIRGALEPLVVTGDFIFLAKAENIVPAEPLGWLADSDGYASIFPTDGHH